VNQSHIPSIEGFEIYGKLGEGGMAQFWRVRHISLNRLVALKILPPRTAADPAETGRFLD
jgi:serine/threonine-protein kinase